MPTSKSVDTHLLLAILKVAKEECARSTWEELEPALETAWEDLRGADTPPWPIVADEIRASCRKAGLVP